jgi:cytochrome c peroxidase
MMNFRAILLVFAVLFTLSCKKDAEDPEPVDVTGEGTPAGSLTEIVPQGWPQPHYTFSANTISENKFVLGRALFYETMLSKDNSISCASCHQDFSAFANGDHARSHGINSLTGNRNTPAIFNLAWHPYFMHDGGVNHIEVQPLAPITNPIEMDENMPEVIARLQASALYKALFKNAYGTDEVTSQRMLWAMTQFQGLIYSYNSTFDKFQRGEKNVELSEKQLRGYNLFKAKCNACHREPLFSDFNMRSNGLSVDPFLQDSGCAHITGLAEDRYKFKTPSLRNIAVTGPYMHDGRYNTLEECLDHYTGKITNPVNLDPLLKNGLELMAEDKKDIIAFLHTLTDHDFLKDKRFTDPNFR